MTVSDKIKTIDNEIKQNKAQYNSERQTAKLSFLNKKIFFMPFFHLKYNKEQNTITFYVSEK